jgi:uncharacterized protein (DUF885 family)
MLAEVAEEMLAEYPENATALGLDKDGRAGLKSRLTDRSLSGQRRLSATASARLEKLSRIDRAALNPATATDLAVVQAGPRDRSGGLPLPLWRRGGPEPAI